MFNWILLNIPVLSEITTIIISCNVTGMTYGSEMNTHISFKSSIAVNVESFIECTLRCLMTDCIDGTYQDSFRQCFLGQSFNTTNQMTGWTSFWVQPNKQHFRFELSWNDAQKHCALWGGRLATVLTKADHNYIQNLTDQSKTLWIGGTDSSLEGVWTWSNPTKPMECTFWDSNLIEPNNINNNEDCLGYYNFGNLGFVWADLPCTDTFQFICEK